MADQLVKLKPGVWVDPEDVKSVSADAAGAPVRVAVSHGSFFLIGLEVDSIADLVNAGRSTKKTSKPKSQSSTQSSEDDDIITRRQSKELEALLEDSPMSTVAFLSITRMLHQHPEGWNGPCECAECREAAS